MPTPMSAATASGSGMRRRGAVELMRLLAVAAVQGLQ